MYEYNVTYKKLNILFSEILYNILTNKKKIIYNQI